MRNKKWWWAIFLYAFGALITNAYIFYCRVMEDAGIPRSQRLTHYEFLLAVATDWIDKDEVTPRDLMNQRRKAARKAARMETEPTTPLIQRGRSRSRSPARDNPVAVTTTATPLKAPRVNEKTLDPNKGSLRCRLNHFGSFHCPKPLESAKPSCALHRYLLGRINGSGGQCRDGIVLCSACGVHLCIPCFDVFHTVRNISGPSPS